MRTDDLTLTEQKNVRTALLFLRVRTGSWRPIAKALRILPDGVQKIATGRPVSVAVAFRVARLAESSIDDLLAGKFTPAGTCPHCGHPPDFTDEGTIVGD